MIKLIKLNLEKECPYGKDVQEDLDVFMSICKEKLHNPNEDFLKRSFDYMEYAHRGINRASGVPYYTHPLKVAISLINQFGIRDENVIAGSLLHDTVEDNDLITLEDIEKRFNKDVAHLVDGVTKIKGKRTRDLEKTATYGKLFMAMVQDPRVILIKLADRYDNMRTLSHLPKEKIERIGNETLNFYVPFAQRLGLAGIKRDMENLSLYYIDKEAFEAIRPKLEQKQADFISYIEYFHDRIELMLNQHNIDHFINIAHKHEYEIYKMIQSGRTLHDIDNFYSFVIVLKTSDYTECYRAYGVVANVFGPVSSLEDYIARPKINLYRALHSTHFGPEGRHVEVIIRTKEMEDIAEEGISALYSLDKVYKVPQLNEQDVAEWVDWMQEIIEYDEQDAISKIWGSIRINLYEEEISVHTNKGQTYQLPKGSSPVDLAFAISKEAGLHLISVKVNKEIKLLNYELKNNDEVEIITSPNSKPMPEWEDFVVTHRALISLFTYFKTNPEQKRPTVENPIQKYFKLKIVGEDRPGLLHDITKEIGQINILRISISTSNSIFEGIFTLNVKENSNLNNLISNLLTLKGLRGVDQFFEEL